MTFVELIAALAFTAQGPSGLTLEETLQLCAKIEDSTDRLSCFEGLAAAASKEGPGPSNTNTFKTSPRSSSPESVENKSDEVPANATLPQTGGDAAVAIGKNDADDATQQNETSEAAPAERQEFIILRADQFEEEKKKAARSASVNPPKRDAFEAVVLKAWRFSATDEQYIALRNGQIWKKTDRLRGRSIRTDAKVKLEPGVAGGWLMKFEDKRPALRVRLVN